MDNAQVEAALDELYREIFDIKLRLKFIETWVQQPRMEVEPEVIPVVTKVGSACESFAPTCFENPCPDCDPHE